jgi:hypothetical protein
VQADVRWHRVLPFHVRQTRKPGVRYRPKERRLVCVIIVESLVVVAVGILVDVAGVARWKGC